jgi:hypothetical protein
MWKTGELAASQSALSKHLIVFLFRIPGHKKGRPLDIDREAERRRRVVTTNREASDEALATRSTGN